MKNNFKISVLAAAVATICSVANATPTSGVYVDDQTQSYVNDATSQGLRLPNTVLCYMNATGANVKDVLNTGNYIALVDKNKCEDGTSSGGSATGSSGSSSAPDYLVTVVNASRTDNNSPLVGKVWFRETSLGDPSAHTLGIIYANMSATQSASSTSPYGKFHTDFCGLADNTTGCASNAPFYGYADGDGASISAFQTGNGNGHQNVAVKLTGTVDAGSGRVKFAEIGGGGGAGDWKFAFNSAYFRRADNAGTNDTCFDRSMANAQKTAWSYGVYNADGSRLNRTSGFPIKTQTGDNGYIGYWGMWLPPSATVNDGDTVTRFSYSSNQASSGSYTVVKKDGRLRKQETHSTTLSGITNVPFYLWVNSTFADSASVSRAQGTQLEVKWDGSNFLITGVVGNNGSVTPVDNSSTAHNIPSTQYDSTHQWGWSMNAYSQSIGGQINIYMRDGSNVYQAPTGSSVVSYRVDTVIPPGSADWPTSLICVNNCPEAGIADATALTAASGNPFVSGTSWSMQPTNSPVTYSKGSGADEGKLLKVGSNVAWTGAAPSNSWYSNGIQSGQMISSADASQIKCDSNGTPNSSGTYYCPGLIGKVSTVYIWETGPNSWNKYAGLKSGSDVVAFDPPMPLTYTVPNNGTPFANASLILQYNGFGDLQGIPGKCVNPLDNSEVQCSNNTRWVSAFAIPEGGTVTSGGTTYYVKPLQQEIRLTKVNASNCSSLTLPTIADSDLPTVSGWTDPTSNGAMPTMPATAAPKVIDGVLQ